MTVADVEVAADPVIPRSKRWRFGWIAELLAVIVIYRIYDWGRDQAAGGVGGCVLERQGHRGRRAIPRHLLGEAGSSRRFLNADWFIAFWNIFYGTVHFVLPVVTLVLLYRKLPLRYVRWRNTLVLMWAIAVLTFFVYPLMPPRLMPKSYGFVDTAAQYFNFGPQVKVEVGTHGQPTQNTLDQYGNPFAAMPSFHVGWSTWCVLALWPLVRRQWLRALLIAYPLAILFCITVTGNHWFLDAVGGWIVLALGWLGAVGLERVAAMLRPRRSAAAADA